MRTQDGDFPTYADILSRPQLQRLLPVLWDAHEVATGQTREWFASLKPPPSDPEREGRAIEPYQASSQVRYLVRAYLSDREWEAAFVEQPHDNPLPIFQREPIPNNGLSLFVDDLHVRVFKADAKGRLPPPSSDRRVAFYNQEINGYLFGGVGGQPILPAHNVVVLWHVRDGTYAFDTLSVAFPIRADLTRDVVEVAWQERYEHPLLSARPAIFDDAKDLPLEAGDTDVEEPGEE